jgi:hypothetical protein
MNSNKSSTNTRSLTIMILLIGVVCSFPITEPFFGFSLNDTLSSIFSYKIGLLFIFLIPFIKWGLHLSESIEEKDKYKLRDFHANLDKCKTKKLFSSCFFQADKPKEFLVLNRGSETWKEGKILVFKKEGKEEKQILSENFSTLKSGQTYNLYFNFSPKRLYRYKILIVTKRGYSMSFPQLSPITFSNNESD